MSLFDELLETPRQEDRILGVITGIVKENWDKKAENQGKVRVEYFLGEKGKNLSGWIPVAMPYTASGGGMYFLPEVGTEVVIAFEMGDRNCPIVIGSLWNQKNLLPEKTAGEKNDTKKVLTANGQEICFSGEKDKQQIEIHTLKGLKILLDDEKEQILLSDKEAKNQLLLDAKNGKLMLNAEKGLELQIGGKALITLGQDKITIEAGTVSEKATQSMKLEGQSMGLKGSSLDIKADGSLKVESSGIAQIKGSMVKIN